MPLFMAACNFNLDWIEKEGKERNDEMGSGRHVRLGIQRTLPPGKGESGGNGTLTQHALTRLVGQIKPTILNDPLTRTGTAVYIHNFIEHALTAKLYTLLTH